MNSKPLAVFLVLSFFALLFIPPHSPAAEKPTVALLQARVVEEIPESALKHLNLDKLLAEMEASFLATRKFTVVTRVKENLEVIRGEQQFAESSLAAGNAAHTGMLENADYLIVPEVHRFVFYAKYHKVPNLQNKYFRTDHGTLEINAQILDSTSGQIKTTFFLKESFSTKERMVDGNRENPSAKHFTDLAKGVSAQMADQFLDVVFPVEIISVKGNDVYLNRGQDGGYQMGDVLQVFLKGEVLIDPHTGDNLGSEEEFIGKIKVTRINPKFTVASVVAEGLQGDMTVGCIVRKPQK